MKKNNPPKTELRHQAKEKLSKQNEKTQPLKKVDTLRLIYELQARQIELEMQNKELVQTQAGLEAAYRQYTDLYDFAPVGYFTLARDGTVRQVNLAGANLLGVDRDKLINRRLGLFVSVESRPAFSAFLKKLLSGKGREICELAFLRNGNESLWVRIEATCFEGGQECRALMMDISERKQVDQALEAVSIELQNAFARQQQLARTDGLTGVCNRRYLFELAGHEFYIAKRYQQPLSVIMFDIDHFKQVNDTFGHAVGDRMLERVTQAARAEIRSADVIGRYGGEEFVIVLPMTNTQQAYPVAERIRTSVAAIRVETDKGQASVTLSIGIAETLFAPPAGGSGGDDSVERVIHRADKTMYVAKADGRNRTATYSAESQGGER